MKPVLSAFVFLILLDFQDDIKIAHHRIDVQGKTLIGEYNFVIDKTGNEDNLDMINRGYDSAKAKARSLEGDIIYINNRRWRYLGRRLVVITEIYKD